MAVFDPAANGWSLQRPLEYEYVEDVLEDANELGSPVALARTPRVLRPLDLTYRAYGRAAFEYMSSFYLARLGSAETFTFEMPEYSPSPLDAPPVESNAGGAQGSRSITVRFAWKKSGALTLPSPTATIAVPANELLTVTLPVYPPGLSQAEIFAAQDDPGNEQSQVTLSDHDRVWTQPDAALLLATSSVPAENTVVDTINCRFLPKGVKIRRMGGLTYEARIRLQEVADGQ